MFSAAKLFFAYGLGNALSFPLAVGATSVLMAERATPAAVFARLRRERPTIFYGVPTLYAAMLASPNFHAAANFRCAAACRPVKHCPRTSAGAGQSTSGSTSLTVWARPKCSTSSFPTDPARCVTARPASRFPAMNCASWTSTGAGRPGEQGNSR